MEGWQQPHRWVIIGVLLAMAIFGAITFQYAAADIEATAKAEELATELEAAGLRAPSDTEAVARVLGTDGGAACDDPASALRQALLDAQLVNGAAFVGQRPVIAPRNVVRGGAIVLQVYCPDVLAAYQDQIADYTFDDVAGE
jgi:hypothetical protein